MKTFWIALALVSIFTIIFISSLLIYILAGKSAQFLFIPVAFIIGYLGGRELFKKAYIKK